MATRGFLRALRRRSLEVGRSLVRTDMVWAWLVLAVSLAVTLWGAHLATTYAQQDAAALFAFRQEEIISAIHHRMQAYEHVLRGGLSLFMAAGEITRRQWQEYVRHLQLDEHYPGIQGLGYIKWIAPADKETYVAQIRAEGFPTFNLRPAEVRPEYTSITYIEPFDTRNQQAFGYDMWSEPVRHTAMQTARDTATTTISGKVTLVQETDTDRQAGVLMYLPRYSRGGASTTVAERRTDLVGFVYGTFRMRHLMEGILGRTLHDIGLEIFDGPELSVDTLMYDSKAEGLEGRVDQQERSTALTATVPLAVHGHTWTARLHTLPAFHAALDTGKPGLILAAGGLISLLFFRVLRSFATTRTGAERLARRMTGELDRAVRELARRAEALAHLNARLTRSNTDLEQFAYAVAHDLQEPLRQMEGFAALLTRHGADQLDARGAQYLHQIMDGSTRMQQLIHDLLEYARISRGDAVREPTCMQDVLRQTLVTLAPRLVETQAEVTYETLPTVLAHPGQLEQLWQNLLSNALKFRSQAPPRIHITATPVDQAWVLAVRDNGIGVAPQFAERIFQLFQRLHTRAEYPGTGIGLALCQKIVERHGGRIWVESQPGHGATFFFTLPQYNTARAYAEREA